MVSDTAWSQFGASDYTPAQWRAACLIDTGMGAEDSKDRYKLPVKEPTGALNRGGVHAAASVLAGGRGGVQASADQKKTAAKALAGMYRSQLSEDPPPSLLAAAGQSGSKEAATPAGSAPGTVQLVEAMTGTIQPGTGRRMYRGRLIEGDRWGSSGYYPSKVLRRDGPQVWPEGTLMYLDHPSVSESADRPERSVRDLAGRIASTPTYEADGLYANVEVFPHAVPIVDGLAEAIGLSIRAAGTAETGEADGRTGPIVTGLTEGMSVDFVTAAGAGGRLTQLLESARTGQPATDTPAAPVSAADGIRRVHQAASHTTATVAEASVPTPPTEVPMGDTPGAGTVTETITPPANQTSTQTAGQTSGQPTTIPLGEATQLNRLLVEARTAHAEAMGRAETAEKRATAAESRTRLVEARYAAEKVVRTALAASPLTEASYQGVVDRVCDSLTVDKAGKPDEKKLAEAIGAEIDTARRREAAILEAHGAGVPTGLGGTSDGPTPEQRAEARIKQFVRLGMTESAAALAAAGKGGRH